MKETTTVHLETKDPWKGQEMRLPIGVMAKIDMPADEQSVLMKSWKSFVEDAMHRMSKASRLNSLNI